MTPRRAAALLAASVLGLCAGCGGNGSAIEHPTSIYRGSALSPPAVAPSFSLEDQSGRQVSLAAQRGHYLIVTFLYTRCPDVCPVIAGNLNAALKTPVARRTGLRVLAISVDPGRDTPAAVRTYVRERGLVPSFRYLTGSRAQLERAWKGFHIAVLDGPKGTVTHSAVQFLIDPGGRELLTYGSDVTAAEVVHDLKLLEQSPITTTANDVSP
jgi:protein SCO1/2